MLDVLEIVFSEGAICVSVFQQNMRPVDRIGVFEEQESLIAGCQSTSRTHNLSPHGLWGDSTDLPADRAAASHTRATGPIEFDGTL